MQTLPTIFTTGVTVLLTKMTLIRDPQEKNQKLFCLHRVSYISIMEYIASAFNQAGQIGLGLTS